MRRLTAYQIEQLQAIVSMAAAGQYGLGWAEIEAASGVPRSESESIWREIYREDFLDLLGALT